MIDYNEIDACDYIGQCGSALYAVTGAESELICIATDFEMAQDIEVALEFWKNRSKVKVRKAVRAEVKKAVKANDAARSKKLPRKAIALSPAEIKAAKVAVLGMGSTSKGQTK